MKKSELLHSYDTYVDVKYRSKETRRIYKARIRQFLRDHQTHSRVTTNQINIYLAKMGDSKYNQMLAALHIIYDKLIHQPQKLRNLNYRSTKQNIWQVLTPEEVRSMIQHTDNLKHKTIITTLYVLGVRREELLELKLSDIDRANMQILIRSGKGRKDRLIDINTTYLHLLERYYTEYKPSVYIFEGKEGYPYSGSSVTAILKRHEQRIGKKIWPHLLRHSIATAMINEGINILKISRFLGHASVKSTERYYHYLQSKGVISLSQTLISQAA